MTEPFYFRRSEREKIINRFGVNFYNKILKDIIHYADKWSLTAFQLIPSYSQKVIFKCQSKQFDEVVLKISDPSSGDMVREYHTLRQYNGRGFCRVFEADVNNGVILESCVKPGISLREENCLEKRLFLFCSIYKGLHIPPANMELYPAYIEWVDRITKYMCEHYDDSTLYLQMKKAMDICSTISTRYAEKRLLHGDLHHDNILLGADGKYVIIDPKGVIGDPVFDIPRFILNEFDDEIDGETYRKINKIIGFLEKELAIPNAILRQCLYVETVMSVCWDVEGGGDYSSARDKLDLVEAALDGF